MKTSKATFPTQPSKKCSYLLPIYSSSACICFGDEIFRDGHCPPGRAPTRLRDRLPLAAMRVLRVIACRMAIQDACLPPCLIAASDNSGTANAAIAGDDNAKLVLAKAVTLLK